MKHYNVEVQETFKTDKEMVMENIGEIIFKTLKKTVGQVNIKTGRKKVKDIPEIKSLKDKRRDTAKRYEKALK